MIPTDLLPREILEEDPLLDSAAQLEEAARVLDLEDWIVQRLKHPEREIVVNLSLLRDSGEAAIFTGIRVQHLRGRAGCLGPVLLARDAHILQLRPLAVQMTLECALFDLPLGGSAGAIVCDPAQLSERELRHLIVDYLTALDTRADIFAPTDFAAAWTHRLTEPATVVGKPAILGGIPQPAAALATGWLSLISEALATNHQPLAACRISLQGFGPSAAALAEKLHAAGARIVALADNSGGLFAERGLDVNAVCKYVEHNRLLYGFPDAEPVRNSDVLEAASDVLIAAAAERQINLQNAARIRAPLIVEAVHNAITPAAERILQSQDATVIPSLLGTAPATLAWFAEWQHGLHHFAPQQDQIETAIQQQIVAAFQRATSSAVRRQAALSDACRLLALEKLANVLRLTR